MTITGDDVNRLAQRWVGVKEAPGALDNPDIVTMLRLDATWPEGDDVPWCSAFVNFVCWSLRLPRSKSLRARSWLRVGRPVESPDIGDIVILKRGRGEQPGPDVIEAPGHVGFYMGHDHGKIHVLGGNQSDSVSISPYDAGRLLGYRRVV